MGGGDCRYTEGILIAPAWHVLHVNRALCHRELIADELALDQFRDLALLLGAPGPL